LPFGAPVEIDFWAWQWWEVDCLLPSAAASSSGVRSN
jgi:hypothetical protein